MDIYAILGELLYIISNYEKGRVKTRGFWSKKYIISLNESLYCMSIILHLMKNPTRIQYLMLQQIKIFCEQNEFIIFPKGDLTRLDDIVNELQVDNLRDDDFEIICYMSRMIDECIIVLGAKNKGYKKRVSCLLKAFHNLPKIFLGRSKKTIYNITTKPILAKDAMLYASSYVDLNLL